MYVTYLVFFVNDTATNEIYTYCHTLALHDALPISVSSGDDSHGIAIGGALIRIGEITGSAKRYYEQSEKCITDALGAAVCAAPTAAWPPHRICGGAARLRRAHYACDYATNRSEGRRVGNGCGSTCSARWSPED